MSIVPVEDSSGPGLPRLWLETASTALPEIAKGICDRIRTEVPEYAEDAASAGETRHAVREALRMFMRTTARGASPDEKGAEVFRRLGRREARAGRSHDTLQNAYRVASQAIVCQLLDWERKYDAPRQVMSALSDAVFAFIDDLARFSAEGFAEAGESSVGDAQLRLELIRLLVHRDGFARRPVTEVAQRIGWTLPKDVTVVEAGCDADLDLIAKLLGPDVLAGRVGERCLVIVPDAVDVEELREQLHDVGNGRLFYVGPTVPLVEAASAARLVQRLRMRHDVRERAVDCVAACRDFMLSIILDASRDATRALVLTRLAPLNALSANKRLKYARLMSAWLDLGSLNGDAPGVLDKHRQTLRYQCTKIEDMFGDELRDRDARLEMAIALRSALPLWERQAENEAHAS